MNNVLSEWAIGFDSFLLWLGLGIGSCIIIFNERRCVFHELIKKGNNDFFLNKHHIYKKYIYNK